MAKKDFSNANTSRVYNSIADATAEPEQEQTQDTTEKQETFSDQGQRQPIHQQHIVIDPNDLQAKPRQPTWSPETGWISEPERKDRRTYDSEETAAAMQAMQTQGKKGMKLKRINMAFAPEIHDYIKVMATVRGQTITDFVNTILQQSLEQNRETYEKAQEFIRGLRSL